MSEVSDKRNYECRLCVFWSEVIAYPLNLRGLLRANDRKRTSLNFRFFGFDQLTNFSRCEIGLRG